MYSALIDKLSALSDDTKVFCGHEYTAANLKFAQHVEPNNEVIAKKIESVKALRDDNKPTV